MNYRALVHSCNSIYPSGDPDNDSLLLPHLLISPLSLVFIPVIRIKRPRHQNIKRLIPHPLPLPLLHRLIVLRGR